MEYVERWEIYGKSETFNYFYIKKLLETEYDIEQNNVLSRFMGKADVRERDLKLTFGDFRRHIV